MKHLDTPIVIINIIALVVLGGSALVAMVIVPAIEAARPTPTVGTSDSTPHPAFRHPDAHRHPDTPGNVTPSGPTPTRPANCAPLPPQNQPLPTHFHPLAG